MYYTTINLKEEKHCLFILNTTIYMIDLCALTHNIYYKNYIINCIFFVPYEKHFKIYNNNNNL